MAPDPALVERARTLRRQGLSNPQIAEELGGLPVSTVRDWVLGVPPPPWTRRPRAKDSEHAAARELRLLGKTYDEIASALGVSKASVSLWVRDLPHPERSPRGEARRLDGLRRYAAERRRQAADARAVAVDAARASLGTLTDRELLVAGVVAYWAEGSKNKPWRRSDRVSFINSDPGMITLFLHFLAAMGVPIERCRFRVSIHESADEAAARTYWSELVGVPVDEFMRSTLKRHRPSTPRRNVGEGYHGCLAITVLRPSELYRAIEGMWLAVEAAASRVAGQQSRVV